MKHNIQIFFQILVLGTVASLWSACENPIKFKGAETDPLLVVNAFVSPDSSLHVSLTESRFFLNNASSFNPVDDAAVCLWVNGTCTDTLQHKGSGMYMCVPRLASGDEIRLTAANPKFAQVDATVKMPDAVPFTVSADNFRQEIRYSTLGEDTLGVYQDAYCDLLLTFSDPSEVRNFYRLTMLKRTYWDESNYTEETVSFQLSDKTNNGVSLGNLINTGQNKETATYNIFNDDFLNGSRVEIKVPVMYASASFGPDDEPYMKSASLTFAGLFCELRVFLHNLSESYYLYLKSRGEAEGYTGSNLFSEPVQVYTNVNGGLGIVGCDHVRMESVRIELSE